ncbi:MAG: Crp/Fnr family transcriptional regulator [Bacteroidota bacterium]
MQLPDFIIKTTPIPRAKADEIASHFKPVSIPKNTLLLQEGKVSQRSLFLEEGIIRCFLNDREGNEITTRFYSAPDFVNDHLSFFKQEPSAENYETLTVCQAWEINLETVQYCFHNLPQFREWGRMMLTMNYVTMHDHMVSFHKYSAPERYQRLLATRPEIVREVPLKYIASYLSITKHSLSRIRKELAHADAGS